MCIQFNNFGIFDTIIIIIITNAKITVTLLRERYRGTLQ